MTKRMIDAEAFSEFLYNSHDKAVCSCCRNFIFTAKQKMDELATPAEPQESIFDAEGWRDDFENIPKYNFHISEHVLIYSQKYNEMFVDWVIFEDGKLSKNQNFNHGSHWRPLPKLPTGGNNEN